MLGAEHENRSFETCPPKRIYHALFRVGMESFHRKGARDDGLQVLDFLHATHFSIGRSCARTMASSSDDPTDLISFFTPEELWEDLIEDWPNQKGKPRTPAHPLWRAFRDKRKQNCGAAALVDGGSEDETSYEAAASAAATLRERLEWDWDGNVRRSQPARRASRW